MARALLADPDWPVKVGSGRADHLIRCVYGNVCKNLDENFRKVVCVLWPKGSINAPDSADVSRPQWPSGADLRARDSSGRIHLSWQKATDAEAIYGYEILRAAGEGPFEHVNSVKGTTYVDRNVIGGVMYRYFVRAYDLAGNRSTPSNLCPIRLPEASEGWSGGASPA